MKPNRQIESMNRFRSGPYTVRVWRSAASVEQAMNDLIGWRFHGMGMGDIAEEIAKMPDVSAVEVTDIDGNGILIYPDWH